MTKKSLALTLIVPLAMAACAKTPPPPPEPVLVPAEQACIARGAQVGGIDPATVTISPTATTKEGDTIYTVVANGIAYNCVASPAGVVSSFTPQ